MNYLMNLKHHVLKLRDKYKRLLNFGKPCLKIKTKVNDFIK